ncbi:ATP-binding cassette domain-containing protein [Streptomyces sp. NPDC048420]|uniref:ATP-binding cassette domain-containing protein n=1 Tax=Streptomyces sp. NPDC048420 TaxID=3155755 RepID=UPI00341F6E33
MTDGVYARGVRYLRARWRVLTRLGAWSVLETGQTFLTGYAPARALDEGFLAGRPGVGLAWLGVAGLGVLVGAYGTVRVYAAVAALVEPLRDALVGRVVERGVREADPGALSGLTQQVEIARDTFAGLVLVSRSFVFTSVGAVVGLASLDPLLLLVVGPPLAAGLALFAATLRPLARRQEDFLVADEALADGLGRVCPGLRDITAAGAEERVAADTGRLVDTEQRAAYSLAHWSVVRVASLALGGQLPIVLLLACAPWLLARGVTPGALVGALAYVTQSLLPALRNLVHGLGTSGSRLVVVLRRLVREPAGEVGRHAGSHDRCREHAPAKASHATPTCTAPHNAGTPPESAPRASTSAADPQTAQGHARPHSQDPQPESAPTASTSAAAPRTAAGPAKPPVPRPENTPTAPTSAADPQPTQDSAKPHPQPENTPTAPTPATPPQTAANPTKPPAPHPQPDNTPTSPTPAADPQPTQDSAKPHPQPENTPTAPTSAAHPHRTPNRAAPHGPDPRADRTSGTAATDVHDRPGRAASPRGGSGPGATPSPALSLSSVTFAYGPAATPVIERLDLTLPPGAHLAVVGPSGIGKSTLTALVAGLLHPSGGEIRLCGHPVPSPEAAARRVLIPQEAYVHTGTLAENLGHLRVDPVPEPELLAAAEAVGLTPLLDALGGPRAQVDPAALSAGERQLVALTRAYLSYAPLVLLDEATCHLDPRAEERAERAFADRPGTTLVVVAHRISSARRADHVLLMDGPRTAYGTHDELVHRSPAYRELVGGWTAVPPNRSEPPLSLRDPDRVDAVAGAGLAGDRGHVVAHGPVGQAQAPRDLRDGGPLRREG